MTAISLAMNLETRILIVDDDPGIRTLISSFLTKYGYVVETVSNPIEMRSKLGEISVDLVVLDVMMPGEDGLTALQGLRKSGGPPVIMLSAVGNDVDRIVGLEMGAEDYLAKPCNPRELLARIRTVLRRREAGSEGATQAESDNVLPFNQLVLDIPNAVNFAGWQLDPISRQLVDPAGMPVLLSNGEFRLLLAFVEHPRRVLTRDQLLEYARGNDSDQFDRAIDVQISRMRRKLSHSASAADLIRTVRNEGYMFMPTVQKGVLQQS